jgi:hypothetical protein
MDETFVSTTPEHINMLPKKIISASNDTMLASYMGCNLLPNKIVFVYINSIAYVCT